MAAVTKPTRPEAQIASGVIATDTDTAATAFGISAKCNEILMFTKVSSRTDGTFTPKIQGSVNGTDWVVLATGTAISSNTSNFTELAVAVDGALPPIIRIVVTSASTASGATVEASVYLNER